MLRIFFIVLFFLLSISLWTFLVQDGVPAKFGDSFSREIMAWQSKNQQVKAVSTLSDDVLATITLVTEGYSFLEEARVLVNGQIISDFGEQRVILRVNPGDIIAVDGSYYEKAFVVRVEQTSPFIRKPVSGQQFMITGTTSFGPVIFE